MDIISTQVKIKIEYEIIKTERVSQELISQQNLKLLTQIVAEFRIFLNDLLLFEERYFNILEFAVVLNKWIDKRIGNFYYKTVDFNDGPILEFIKISDNEWKIQSIWQLYEQRFFIEEQHLFLCLQELLSKLQKDFLELYGINLTEFTHKAYRSDTIKMQRINEPNVIKSKN